MCVEKDSILLLAVQSSAKVACLLQPTNFGQVKAAFSVCRRRRRCACDALSTAVNLVAGLVAASAANDES